MQARIQVIAVENRKGVSKSSQQAYDMDICKCVVTLADGRVDIGELVLPKGHAKVVPGVFEAEFQVAVGFDKRISGQLKELRPVSAELRKAS